MPKKKSNKDKFVWKPGDVQIHPGPKTPPKPKKK